MTIKELKHSVYAKRLEIRDIVQDSWRTQAEILHYQEMFNDAMKMSQKSVIAALMPLAKDQGVEKYGLQAQHPSGPKLFPHCL